MLLFLSVLGWFATVTWSYPRPIIARQWPWLTYKCQFKNMSFPIDGNACFTCDSNNRQNITILIMSVSGTMVASAFQKRNLSPLVYQMYSEWNDSDCTEIITKIETELIVVKGSCRKISCPFVFHPPVYENRLVPDDKFRLNFGYNIRLLGCPQPLCLDANVDAASYSDQTLFIHVGRYKWAINEANSKRFTEEQRIPFEPIFSTVYLNRPIFGWPQAAWYVDREYVIFDGSYYVNDMLQFYSKIDSKWPDVRHAVAAFSMENTIYVFQGKEKGQSCFRHICCIAEKKEGQVTLTSFNLNATKDESERVEQKSTITDEPFEMDEMQVPDAAFVKENTDVIYVLRGWKYATLSLQEIQQKKPEFDWRFSFLEVFRCSSHTYMNRHVGKFVKVRDFREYLENYGEEGKSWSPTFVPLIVMAVIVALQLVVIAGAFVAWHKFRKQREQGLISMMSAYNKKGKKGNEERLSKVLSGRVKSKMSGCSSDQLGSNRSRLSGLESVGQSKVELGSTPKSKKK